MKKKQMLAIGSLAVILTLGIGTSADTLFAEAIHTNTEEADYVTAGRTVMHYDINKWGGDFSMDEFGDYHYTLNGTIIKDAFFCDGMYTYYLQADGTPMKNRLTYHPDGEHVIYFDEDGHEVFDSFVNVRRSIAGEAVDDICYFNTFGYMYVDVITYDREGVNLYYLNPYGVMQEDGWFTFSDGKVGYAYEDGVLYAGKIGCAQDGKIVYFGGDGKIATTPVDLSGYSMEKQYEYRVIELVNQKRLENGVNPLQIDEELIGAAEVRANEISTSFSHTRPDGRECFSILDDRGIDDYWFGGENIAYGYVSPEDVMEGWMNSTGHRENILDSDFDSIGVGTYNSGRINWVQLFGGR